MSGGEREARPRAWPALATYAAAFVASLVASTGLVSAVAAARVGTEPHALATEVARFATSVPGLCAVAGIDAAVLAGTALLAARRGQGGRAASLRLGPSRASGAGLAAAVAGTAGLSLACGGASDLVGVGRGEVMSAIARATHEAGPGGLTLAMVALAAAPGLGEELFFRGYLQTRLARSWGRLAGLLAASAAFGLLHVDPVQGALAFAIGTYLGAVADRFGSIRPSMLAHASNNAMFVGLSHFAAPSRASRAQAAAVVAAGLAVCAVATGILRSRAASAPPSSDSGATRRRGPPGPPGPTQTSRRS